jgi:hypothetical protein
MPPSAPRANGREQDARIARLSREIADVVHEADPRDRDTLREYAADLVREDTATAARPEGASIEKPGTPRRFSPFALAALLLLGAGLFLVVLPPAGVVLLLVSVVLMGWGVVDVLASRRADDTSPPSAPPPQA